MCLRGKYLHQYAGTYLQFRREINRAIGCVMFMVWRLRRRNGMLSVPKRPPLWIFGCLQELHFIKEILQFIWTSVLCKICKWADVCLDRRSDYTKQAGQTVPLVLCSLCMSLKCVDYFIVFSLLLIIFRVLWLLNRYMEGDPITSCIGKREDILLCISKFWKWNL